MTTSKVLKAEETKTKFTHGEIVKPNHKGENAITRKVYDWSVYKGAIKGEPWLEGNQYIVEVIWFGEAKNYMPKTYPVADLKSTGKFWEKLRNNAD